MSSSFQFNYRMTYVSIGFFKIFCVDLFADDLSPDEVFLEKTETHLLQYKVNLFFLLHRTKSFNLQIYTKHEYYLD